jgi:SAM-dependent methyltransferase
MPTTISQYLHHQHAPEFLRRFPFLLYPYYSLNRLSVQRVRYARRAVNRIIRSGSQLNAVTDAGCGLGDFLFTIPAVRNAEHVTGIDISSSNIELCRSLAGSIGATKMNFICSDLSEEELPGGQDLIICVGVIMYIKDDEALIRKFFETLSVGGRVVIYAAVNYRRNLPLYKRLSQTAGFDYDEVFGRAQTYTDGSLEQLLKKCGFTVERAEYSFGKTAATLYEVSSLFEWFVKTKNPLLSLIVLPFYVIFYPFYLLSLFVDYHTSRSTGNGVAITAVKNKVI